MSESTKGMVWAGVVLGALYTWSFWLHDSFVLPTAIGVLGPAMLSDRFWTGVLFPSLTPLAMAPVLWPWYDFASLLGVGVFMGLYIALVAYSTAKGLVRLTHQSSLGLNGNAQDPHA